MSEYENINPRVLFSQEELSFLAESFLGKQSIISPHCLEAEDLLRHRKNPLLVPILS